MTRIGLLLLLIVASGTHLNAHQSAPASEAHALHVSLEQRFGRAIFRSCELTVEMVERIGRATLRCVWNTSPPSDFISNRALTSQETERLLALTTGSDILSDAGTGNDLQAADGVTETVTIQRGVERTVLVASGNPSFEGSRHQLLNLLHSIIEDLRRANTK